MSAIAGREALATAEGGSLVGRVSRRVTQSKPESGGRRSSFKSGKFCLTQSRRAAEIAEKSYILGANYSVIPDTTEQ